jgi:ADP-ribose pyrophosphatase YjhB (NUDIX family)
MARRTERGAVTAPHRIAAGALVLDRGKLLLLRHRKPGVYDFSAPPGGGVEGAETLERTVERETFEETGLRVEALRMAYVEELIDDSGRMVKFRFLARYLAGEIDVLSNPSPGERITEAGWFGHEGLPEGHVFPAVTRDDFWRRARDGFPAPIRLPLTKSVF